MIWGCHSRLLVLKSPTNSFFFVSYRYDRLRALQEIIRRRIDSDCVARQIYCIGNQRIATTANSV